MKSSFHARGISLLCAGLAAVSLFSATAQAASLVPSLRVLFLGDNGHHRPADRFKQLQPILATNGIEMVYTDAMEDLNPANLAGFDCLVIYANTTRILPDQEKAMMDFVATGA